MAKSLQRVKLHGVLANNKPAKTSDAKSVVGFASVNGKITIDGVSPLYLMLHTGKSNRTLTKHATQNYYFAYIGGFKVQVSLKKVVAELRYWA